MASDSPLSPETDHGPLPDLFAGMKAPVPVEAWEAHRPAIAEACIPLLFGGLPPAPAGITADLLGEAPVRRWDGAPFRQYRVGLTGHPGFAFRLDLQLPTGEGPFPVILSGDGCWRYQSDAVVEAALERGYALAQFARTELAPDRPDAPAHVGLRTVYPDQPYGAIAAWAWGYHRSIDALTQLPDIDPNRIIATGHSRGGKAALLAGATDPRIALTNPNGSGAGGAGCCRKLFSGAETLQRVVEVFPWWFGPAIQPRANDPVALPFDLHFLKALVAPRALLCTEASGDRWANPEGSRLTSEAAQAVWALYGAEDQLGYHLRDGGHAHAPEDWLALMAFADKVLPG